MVSGFRNFAALLPADGLTALQGQLDLERGQGSAA